MEEAGANIREDRVWLMQSRINPVAIPGSLILEDGRLSFVLDETASGASLDWLEKHLGREDLTAAIEGGERIAPFDLGLAECQVSWPVTGGGAVMLVDAPDRRWVISYDQPTGKSLTSGLWLFSGRRKARDWKIALAAAGV